MLRRKIEQKLLQWKSAENHNPLVVKGCRQCGKTFSVIDFAKKNYKNVVYLNFFENPEYSQIFSGSLEIDKIVMYITAALGNSVMIEAGNTCIVLDEIQECPKARTALKFFKLDGRYDVICTGSLLGLEGYRSEPVSIPVGYETVIDMYPLDFEEFLWANGITEEIIRAVDDCVNQEIPVPQPLHTRFRSLLLQYAVVGGMPRVVDEFIKTHLMNVVLEMQRNIVNSYRDDMVKYSLPSDKSLIRECFNSIPKQLAKDNKKFQYSILCKGGTASKFRGSLQWIEDAGIVCRCYNLTIPELPLDGNAIPSEFKVYMCDTGLFISMLENGTQSDVLQGNMYGYKGAIFENLMADFLVKMGRKPYYYRKDSGLEIDFIIRYKGKSTLVEVKATNGNAKSAKTILNHPEKYHVDECLKFGDYNIGRQNGFLTLPFYAAFMLEDRY